MRLFLVGSGSFIARHIYQAAREKGMDVVALPHDVELAPMLMCDDVVVNCALDPQYFSGTYSEQNDYDLRTARDVANAGARMAMLSTRRVYPSAVRWNARETDDATGDETAYGKNKARSEACVLDLFDGRVAVFRLSNVFGYEFEPGHNRRTFVAQMMRTLKTQNIVRFDMHPNTCRDFIPVEACAKAILARLQDGMEGIVNLGCGLPVRCGDLARWVMEGYGDGDLIVDLPVVRDEFYLNMDLWQSKYGSPVDRDGLRSYCKKIGERLQLAKF